MAPSLAQRRNSVYVVWGEKGIDVRKTSIQLDKSMKVFRKGKGLVSFVPSLLFVLSPLSPSQSISISSMRLIA
jgi:hypothetical protein